MILEKTKEKSLSESNETRVGRKKFESGIVFMWNVTSAVATVLRKFTSHNL